MKEDGTVDKKLNIEKWTKRRTLERQGQVNGMRGVVVGVPARNDVLSGKGRAIQNHIGNMRFRQLIQDCRNTYDNADYDEKKTLTLEVLGIVKQSGGRFLIEAEVGWVEVDDETARKKIGNTFRGIRKLEGRKEDKTERKNKSEREMKREKPENASSSYPQKKKQYA